MLAVAWPSCFCTASMLAPLRIISDAAVSAGRTAAAPQALKLPATTQLPASSHQLADVGGQLVEVLQVAVVEATVQTRAEALGGLGGVLGDVAGNLRWATATTRTTRSSSQERRR
jgi:hypothetical protein